ncbi:MAG: YggT family protein [Candidatus Gastranaerophilales bacterium]|nr:YggT family protein [Candidatus Gastranaerophilales bacterium]
MLSVAVARTFDLIFLILFIAIVLTWVPNLNWNNEPFKTLRAFSEFFFAPFRKFIPPIGMIDLSPIVAFFMLQLLSYLLVKMLVYFGL